MEIDCDKNIHPSTVPKIAVGIEMTTAIGSVQLSYWAAKTRIVMTMAKIRTIEIVVPDWVS